MGPWKKAVLALGLMGSSTEIALADSIWARRDPRVAYLFNDYRARHVGDLLTIVVSESTEFEGLEKREMDKKTDTSIGMKVSGTGGSNGVNKNFNGALDASNASKSKFDGKSNASIDRRFVDRMTVTVVAVLPNGNLVIEGYRRSSISREQRLLQVSGIVRPADIGALNTVQSQYIANFDIVYMGRGPESAYTNQGWFGRALNVLWPY